MPDDTYLNWVGRHTATQWWHDSGERDELECALARGAVGVTTNPYLANLAVRRNRNLWEREIAGALSQSAEPEWKAEALSRIVAVHAAAKLLPRYEQSAGAAGYVCAQVNPNHAGNRECMLAAARRYAAWAPNIAVKVPATAAALDVLEDAVAEGITVAATVSFTVPQVVAAAERCRAGMARARTRGVKPGKCFAVLMIGRLDDYLREVANDNRSAAREEDIRQAGLAVTKRAYRIYREREYEAVLLVAALRGEYHLTELAGADLVVSIAPAWQERFVSGSQPREERIDREISPAVLDRLRTMPEFVRAYEPDGMAPEEFVSYGVTQRTLSQFIEAGWKPLESFQ